MKMSRILSYTFICRGSISLENRRLTVYENESNTELYVYLSWQHFAGEPASDGGGAPGDGRAEHQVSAGPPRHRPQRGAPAARGLGDPHHRDQDQQVGGMGNTGGSVDQDQQVGGMGNTGCNVDQDQHVGGMGNTGVT